MKSLKVAPEGPLQPDSTGKLIIVSAPSGAGKTTIVHHLLSQPLGLVFSVSATSRSPRPGEINGHDYYFMDESEFRQKITEKAFVEWEEVYPGVFYGTLKSEISRIHRSGKNVIFDVDVVGGLNLKKIYKKKALALFIEPPSVEVLRERLRRRSTDSEATILTRIAKAELELSFAPEFDRIIINDNLESAFREAETVVKEFLSAANR